MGEGILGHLPYRKDALLALAFRDPNSGRLAVAAFASRAPTFVAGIENPGRPQWRE